MCKSHSIFPAAIATAKEILKTIEQFLVVGIRMVHQISYLSRYFRLSSFLAREYPQRVSWPMKDFRNVLILVNWAGFCLPHTTASPLC